MAAEEELVKAIPMITDWIEAVSTAILTLGIFVAFWQSVILRGDSKQMNNQLELMKTQLANAEKHITLNEKRLTSDHERSRNERAIDLMIHFDQALRKENSMAKKLFQRLDNTQLRKIFEYEPVKISSDLKLLAEGVLGYSVLKENGDLIELDERFSAELRWAAVQYLNLLETVLLAWHNEIADKEIIKRQLSYLYTPEEGDNAMEKFRVIVGGKRVYPAIHAFIEELKKEANAPESGKEKVA